MAKKKKEVELKEVSRTNHRANHHCHGYGLEPSHPLSHHAFAKSSFGLQLAANGRGGGRGAGGRAAAAGGGGGGGGGGPRAAAPPKQLVK